MGKKQKTIMAGAADEGAEDLHANMLAQLGLKAGTKEGRELLGVLKKKLGKNKRARGEDEQAGQEEAEESGAQEEYDDGKLTIGDLFSSIDRSKQVAAKGNQEEVINTNRLQKQLKNIRKEAQVTALTAPLSGRKRLKIERQENYE
jgi:hypothetical protein